MINGYWARVFGLEMCILTKSKDIEIAREEANTTIAQNLNQIVLMVNKKHNTVISK